MGETRYSLQSCVHTHSFVIQYLFRSPQSDTQHHFDLIALLMVTFNHTYIKTQAIVSNTSGPAFTISHSAQHWRANTLPQQYNMLEG